MSAKTKKTSKRNGIVNGEAPGGSKKDQATEKNKVQIEIAAQGTGQESGNRNLNLKYYQHNTNNNLR